MVLARQGFGEAADATDADVLIRRVGPPGLCSTPVPGNPRWAFAITHAIREFRPDLVMVRDLPLALPAALRARRSGIPVIMDMAEHYPEAMRSWGKYAASPLARFLVHDLRIPDYLEARVVRLVDGIVVVCDENAERLRDSGVDHARLVVVRNTPEAAFRSAVAATPLEQRQNPTRFGYLGHLAEDRQLETILVGFDLAASRNPSITLLIAGGGESEHNLRAIAAGLNSRDRIRFTGRYRLEDQATLYAGIDFGIVSLRRNVFTEHTLGNKFFDYPALGKPFIYPNLPPLCRVMSEMGCGVSFEAGSAESAAAAILAILDADYSAMSAAGRAAISREFNWEVDSARLTEFVDRISATVNR